MDTNEGDSVNNFDMQSAYYMRENFPKILKLLPPSGTLKVFLGLVTPFTYEQFMNLGLLQ